jgi:hypothetical protein
MPAITFKTTFSPHVDSYFGVQVNTEEEQKICDMIKEFTVHEFFDQRKYMFRLIDQNPEIKNDRLFKFTFDLLKIKGDKESKSWTSQIANETIAEYHRRHADEHIKQDRPDSSVVQIGSDGKGFLSRIIDAVIVEQAAWSGVDPQSDVPCSTQYMQSLGLNKILYQASNR